MKQLILFYVLPFMLFSCQPSGPKGSSPSPPSQSLARPAVYEFQSEPVRLSDYWYQGAAEVSRYELHQNRYADVHPGTVIAVFVTEDFLADKQVKNDNYSNPNSIPILKMNMINRFTTGLYDYSVMRSVFTPVKVKEHPQTLKVSTTSQDWCGHVYMQLNFRDGQYASTLHSYFENEADQQQEVPYAILEDELFNRIRMNPEGLPTGPVSILPSTMIVRLKHLPFQAVQAQASLTPYQGTAFQGDNLRAYSVNFPSLKRTLQIVFQAEEPYLIEGWTDAYPSMSDGKVRTTLARRTKTIREKYWQKHGLEDTAMRQELGLEFF